MAMMDLPAIAATAPGTGSRMSPTITQDKNGKVGPVWFSSPAGTGSRAIMAMTASGARYRHHSVEGFIVLCLQKGEG